MDLARQLYASEDVRFILLDAGHAALAEHFRAEVHPKGSWVLDLLLGKE